MHTEVECWPVGQHIALHAPRNGALALANESAEFVWHALAASGNTADVGDSIRRRWGLNSTDAASLLNSLIAEWRSVGLIAGEAKPHSSTACRRIAPLRSGTPRFFRTGFGQFSLTCRDSYAAEVMSAVLEPLRDMPGAGLHGRRVELRGGKDGYWVTRDGVPKLKPGNISYARHEVLKQLIIDETDPLRASAVLHAAAVAIRGRAVVIAGDCGRGKSTLTACLVHDGAGYVGDDLIPLESNGRWISAYPVALSVKSGSWHVVEPLHASAIWSREIQINHHRLKYVDLSAACPREQRLEVGAIIMPHYTPRTVFQADKVEPEQALNLLIAAGSRAVGMPSTIEGLCRLVHRTPVWKLTYGEWRDAARFIDAEMKVA